MTIDGSSNLSIPTLECPKRRRRRRRRRRGRRTNIERVPEHAHDCIPSIRADIGALQMWREKKKERREQGRIYKPTSQAPNVPINARKVMQCGAGCGWNAITNCVIIASRHPELERAFRPTIEVNDKRRDGGLTGRTHHRHPRSNGIAEESGNACMRKRAEKSSNFTRATRPRAVYTQA